jgi:putative oxidoreductase
MLQRAQCRRTDAPARDRDAEKGTRMTVLQRLGQLCLGVMFIKLGSDAARAPGDRPKLAAELGVPNPELAVRASGAVMTLAGLALALDRWPRLAALVLAAALAPTTLAGHAFWKSPHGSERSGNQIQFLKNLGLLGGLLAIASQRRPATHA